MASSFIRPRWSSERPRWAIAASGDAAFRARSSSSNARPTWCWIRSSRDMAVPPTRGGTLQQAELCAFEPRPPLHGSGGYLAALRIMVEVALVEVAGLAHPLPVG